MSYDPAHDAYYVSNVNGSVGVKDGNGFITRITADGRVSALHFIQGGRNGIELTVRWAPGSGTTRSGCWTSMRCVPSTRGPAHRWRRSISGHFIHSCRTT